MSTAPDPFTWATLGTIGGATLACSIVPNVLGKVLPIPDRVRAGIALILALAIEVGLLFTQAGDHSWQPLVVAVLNGFLVAAAALGVNQTATAGGPQGFNPDANSSTFRASWI